MQLLSGVKAGSDVLFLSDYREIASDNLWAIRALIGLLFLSTFMGTSSAQRGPAWLLGSLLGMAALYWSALRLASSDETGSDTNANVPRM